MWDKIAPIIRLLGGLVDFLRNRHVAKATAAVVQQQTAQNVQDDQDAIAGLIHTAHYDPDPDKRRQAFEEIQRRQAIT